MTFHTPIPQDLRQEAIKCAGILEKFMKPEQGNLDKVIPPNVVDHAKGLAVMTVIKAGFVWSGRAGSGLVVARLPDGSWSAPSAIATAGAGFGGQIGAEITDFVIVLNTEDAVKAFSMGGNVTLGGNLSVSAGPMGRSVEAGGTLGKLAPVYSYSKSKGLFAGVSIEGSVILERKEANAQFYGRVVSAKDILGGKIQRPAECDVLYRAIEKQIQLGRELEDRRGAPTPMTTKYGLNVVADTINKTFTRPGQPHSTALSPAPMPSSSYASTNAYPQTSYPSPTHSPHSPAETLPSYSTLPAAGSKRPPVPPNRPSKPMLARALYTFTAERDSDLSFEEGEIITVTRKTDSQYDWWSGKLNNRMGDVLFY
jgi:lipid-binding SYLF domain-containing protein